MSHMEALDEQLWARFQALHLQIKDYVHNAVEEGAHHKSYEGRMTISFGFPSCFGENPYVSIHLWSYLLGPEVEHLDRIAKLIEQMSGRELYLDLLKLRGRVKGIETYRKLREAAERKEKHENSKGLSC